MNQIIDLYIELLKWDIEVMSKPWLYFTGLILFFLPFFLAKWAVLTAPIWIPFGLILNAKK